MPPTALRLLATAPSNLPTATTLRPLPTRTPVLKATETPVSVPIALSTDTVPRTLTSATEPLLTDPLRTTVMPLSRTVPVATNSEEPLLPLPTRLDTRRTSTESGVASTAPRSDTESLAPRPMRLTPTVVVPLRTTVHALVPLASVPPVRLAADALPPLPTAPTDGAVPAVTGDRPLLVSRVLAPMPLPASLATDHSVMPPPEASVTNGPAREVLRAPRATPRALPTRTLTPDPWMPLLATTPLLSPLPDSDRETRLPLPTVSDRLAVLDTPTPPLLAASVRVP